MVPHAVAAALGHGSFALTAKHYAQPEAIVEARTARVLDVLDLARAAEPAATAQEQAQRLLQSLDPQTLAHLTELLAQKDK